MKDIVVYTESLRAWPNHMEYAASMAVAFDAHLTGLCVCPSPEAGLPSFDAPAYAVEWADQIRELMNEACKAEAGFLDEARQRHLEKASWQVAQGYVPECLAQAGDWHDVLVLGLDPASAWGSPSAIGSIMLGSDIPCLLVPASFGAPFSIDSVAIAWNGSTTALHAVHTALPILMRAQHITVLEGDHVPSPMDRWQPRFDLFRYLRQHGVLAQQYAVVKDGNSIGHNLLQAATRAKAGLLVMGGYGHTRLRERMLGGATLEVLERTTIPVWMQH